MHIPCAVHLESLQILKSGPGGRQRRDDKKGIITAEHATILAKLGFAAGIWCDLVWNFKRYFGGSRGPGSSDRMREESISDVRKCRPGQKKVCESFLFASVSRRYRNDCCKDGFSIVRFPLASWKATSINELCVI
jgi:hypothetical protein